MTISAGELVQRIADRLGIKITLDTPPTPVNQLLAVPPSNKPKSGARMTGYPWNGEQKAKVLTTTRSSGRVVLPQPKPHLYRTTPFYVYGEPMHLWFVAPYKGARGVVCARTVEVAWEAWRLHKENKR